MIIHKQILKDEQLKQSKNIFGEDDIFVPFFEYFVSRFEERFNYELTRIPSAKIEQRSVLISVLLSYKKKLEQVSSKVLIFEFHEWFDESDPADTTKFYRLFSEQLKNPYYITSILDKYPVLQSTINSLEEKYIRNHIKLISRYHNDYKDIEKKLNQNPGNILSISANLGDTHRGGNSVAKVQCENIVIMYKPRSLQVDCLYETITDYFNQSSSLKIKTVKTINKELYGWQEYIDQQELSKIEDARKYFKRLGIHLGFIYMFHGSDFHYENIMAHGSSPVLVDLETLFQPVLDFNGNNDPEEKSERLIDKINQTVYKSLVLNHRTYPEDNSLNNYYGLSNIEGQQYPEERVLHKGTDHMTVRTVITEMSKGTNLPILNNEVVDIIGYEDAFMCGFEEVYKFFLNNQHHIIRTINSFPDFPVRLVLRPTYVYTNYLQSLRHPKYQKAFEERDRILSFFNDSYKAFQAFQTIIPNEIADLQNNDVPYFYTFFKQADLYSKEERINCQIVQESPLLEVINRISNLSAVELRHQLQLINMSLTSTFYNMNRYTPHEFSNYNERTTAKNLDEFISAETENIYDQRLETKDNIQWISLSANLNGDIVAGPVSYGLYDGIAGIAYYLAAYSQEQKDDLLYYGVQRINDSLKKSLHTSILKDNLSAYYGISSYSYYVEKLRAMGMIDSYEANKVYMDFCSKIAEQLNDTVSMDFVGGLAGTLKVLTLLYRNHRSPKIWGTANQVYSKLISKLEADDDDTVYWYSDSYKNTVLAGFSHGLTGICYALSEYSTITSENTRREIADIITRALSYEDKLYDPKEQNWKDNREDNTNSFSLPFWCHGAAGILLGRVKIKQNLGHLCFVNYIPEALATTLNNGNNHTQGNSLCHGTMGNLDILQEVIEASSLQPYRREIEQTISKWIKEYWESMNTEGWKNGINKDFSSAGLMLGRTGQLYTLLRLRNTSLPSLLLLD